MRRGGGERKWGGGREEGKKGREEGKKNHGIDASMDTDIQNRANRGGRESVLWSFLLVCVCFEG